MASLTSQSLDFVLQLKRNDRTKESLKKMGKFQVIDHPLIQHKLTIIRDKNCGTKVFREVVDEIAMLMAYEVSRDMPLEDIVIETPITETTQKTLSGKKVAIIPILRAGIGMVDGILELIPAAKVGHIGLYRDEETFEPHEYFVKLPEDIDARQLFVVDPMLATGGSAIMAIDALKERGASNIKFVCLVAAPEGVKALQEAHPDIDIYTASLDEKLNEHGYIVPGLGDAGDRLFGTK
ncbi:uracil phosphoribosyltransferase [Enterococcus faecium 1,141,733]|jgi:uracil phosphoribosyltransferase|nr:uracil phosphoribosyltransferase [Enterococcus faecium 1,141,733]EJV49352.1 uracil phosphoribosyltransferase [Enterococcus faecium TX1337RF]